MSKRSTALLRLALLACLLWAIAQSHVRLGIALGERWIPRGEGYPAGTEIQANLFRFDSGQYYSIAERGYAYNGDPNSEPNIVFGPLFPWLTAAGSAVTRIDLLTFGFALNETLLLLALALLLDVLRPHVGWGGAFATLLASTTAAGSYAYHAFYSESVTFFFLALALWACQRRRWGLAAVACGFLGACRLAAAAPAAVFAVAFTLRAVRGEGGPAARARFAMLAAVCLAGTALYLGLIAWRFGDPLRLLPEIQNVSWSAFHRPTSWPSLLSGAYLARDWAAVFGRGAGNASDIRTLNLVWMSLGLVSCAFMILRYRASLPTFLTVAYCLFVYAGDAGSEFLISAHRFMVFVLPIFLLFVALHRWLARKGGPGLAWAVSGALLALNAGYGLWHTACFNQGVWYYF